MPDTRARRARDTGKHNASRGLNTAPPSPPTEGDSSARTWTIAQKARVLTDGEELSGAALYVYLKRRGVSRVDYDRWRHALQEGPQPSAATIQRMDKLKRALARQQRVMSQAAALLIDKPDHTAAKRRGRGHQRSQRPSRPITPRTHEDIHPSHFADNSASIRTTRRGPTTPGDPGNLTRRFLRTLISQSCRRVFTGTTPVLVVGSCS